MSQGFLSFFFFTFQKRIWPVRQDSELFEKKKKKDYFGYHLP